MLRKKARQQGRAEEESSPGRGMCGNNPLGGTVFQRANGPLRPPHLSPVSVGLSHWRHTECRFRSQERLATLAVDLFLGYLIRQRN
jgi:hypothetical protein